MYLYSGYLSNYTTLMEHSKCFLVCPNNTHEPIIELHHGQPVIIGRPAVTRVTDTLVSRNHVELTSTCETRKVVRQLGVRSSTADGHVLNSGESSELGAGGSLCLLADKYTHIVNFKAEKAGWDTHMSWNAKISVSVLYLRRKVNKSENGSDKTRKRLTTSLS